MLCGAATSAWALNTSDQLFKAAPYQPLVLSYRNGGALQLSDVADVLDSVEDLRNAGYANGKPAVLLIIFRQPGANIIDTVDRIKALLPVAAGVDPADHRSRRSFRTAPPPSAPRSATSSSRC